MKPTDIHGLTTTTALKANKSGTYSCKKKEEDPYPNGVERASI